MSRKVETGTSHLINLHDMFTQGDCVCAAVSGGADSVALLHFLHTKRDELGIELLACHVNHNLRGAESDRDEQFTRALCERLGVKLFVESVDVNAHAQREKLGTEEAARDCRYLFFSRLHCELGCKIATAHTLTDKTETLLLNITRGTGIRGIASIPPVRDFICRPLLSNTRAEIEDYCARNALDYVQDSTNFSEIYARNKIRLGVLPKLGEINPHFQEAVGRLTEQVGELNLFLDELAANALNNLVAEGGAYNKSSYLALPRPLASRVMEQLLKEKETKFDSKLFERIEAHLQREIAQLQIGENLYLSVQKEIFCFVPKEIPYEHVAEEYKWSLNALPRFFSLQNGQTIYFERSCCEQTINFAQLEKNSLKIPIDYDKISSIVVLRHRKPGDQIKLWGRGMTKTFKKLFNEAKLPLCERDKLLVLADENGPIWLEAFGVAERVAIDQNTKKALNVYLES